MIKSKTIGNCIKEARIAKSRRIYANLKSTEQRIAFSENSENMFRQGDLARASNTSRALVSAWERNAIEPKILSLRKLAKVLEVSVFDLIPEN